MSVGILLGVMAGCPWLSSSWLRGPGRTPGRGAGLSPGVRRAGQSLRRLRPAPAAVIILAGPGMGQQQPPGYPQGGYMAGSYPALPNPDAQMPPASGRRFKVVGEKEEWVDEWT